MALENSKQPGPARVGVLGHDALVPDPRTILNSIGEVVYDWDLTSDRVCWGANAVEVLGFHDISKIATGHAFAELLAPESPRTRYEAVTQAAGSDEGSGAAYQAQYGLVLPGRDMRGDSQGRTWIEDKGRVFTGADGKPVRAHGIIRIITERFEAERQLAFRSVFDPLTGALNRTNLADHLARLFKQNSGKQRSFATLLVGIRGLARINREYGYDVADEIIAGLVNRMRGNLRAVDIVGRYSGNKFALVLDTCDGEQMLEAARRMISVVDADPVATSSGAIPVAIRIGGVLAPRYARNAQMMLQHAEEALEAARDPVQKGYVAYMPSLAREDARVRALRMTDDLLAALNERRIVLAFQPIIAAASGKTVWQEGLMRLHNADGTLAFPGHILPMAEKAGLIGLIDYRVLELSLAHLRNNPEAHLTFNVSMSTLHDPEWPDRLRSALALAPGAAERLMVEITETAAVENLDMTRAAISAMKRMGIRVAMDDFGAGHTSFRNLRGLGFDVLKIDGAFMQNLSRSPDDRLFVRTLIELARHLGIPTVAEWVEDAETASILTGWGVDYLQGHHFGEAKVPPAPEAFDAASALAG